MSASKVSKLCSNLLMHLATFVEPCSMKLLLVINQYLSFQNCTCLFGECVGGASGMAFMKVIGQLSGTRSLLPCILWGSNVGCRVGSGSCYLLSHLAALALDFLRRDPQSQEGIIHISEHSCGLLVTFSFFFH